MDVVKKIYDMQKERDWSSYRLADEAGIAESTISSWYSKKQSPTIGTLEKICAAFGISMAQFFMEETDQEIIVTEQQKILLNYLLKLDPPQFNAIFELARSICEQKSDSERRRRS